jgi:hypothetical protein
MKKLPKNNYGVPLILLALSGYYQYAGVLKITLVVLAVMLAYDHLGAQLLRNIHIPRVTLNNALKKIKTR